MPASPLTVTLPEPLLKQIRGRARRSKRTVEAEVIQLLSDAVAAGDRVSANGAPATKPGGKPGRPVAADSDDVALPPDIAKVVAVIPSLDDQALRARMKPLITPKQAERLAELNYKAQAKGLTAAERAEQERLLHVYEKAMVVRAAVMAELHRRGVDVAKLIAP